MRNTWRQTFRRLAAAGTVSAAASWSSAMCYAVQLAYDSPDDPIYASGWAHGQNGGTGFTAWNFLGSSWDGAHYDNPVGSGNWVTTPGQHAIDNGLKSGGTGSSEFNDIGKAWTIFNKNGRNQASNNAPSGGTDIARAGRGFSFGDGELEPGQTVSIVVDNPTERNFYRGWTITFNYGLGNFGPHGSGTKPRIGIGTFDYFSYGRWGPYPNPDNDDCPCLLNTDTNAGVQIDFTLTSIDTFSLAMTPLDNSGGVYTVSGMLATDSDGNPENGDDMLLAGKPLNWIQIQFYNTDSDFYPTQIATRAETDFYIRSMEVTDAAPPDQAGDYNNDGKVDAADYVAWRKLPAQFGGDPGGYNTWRENFGEGGGSGEATGVPEPSTFVSLIVATAGLFLAASRRLPQH